MEVSATTVDVAAQRRRALDVPTRTYAVRPERSASEVLTALFARLSDGSASLEAVTGEVRTTSWRALDSADRRLAAAGLDLRLETDRGSGRLVLHTAGGDQPLVAAVGRAVRRMCVGDLPEGPLRDRLAPVVGVRALLSLVQLRRRDHLVEVHDGEAKTVVRLMVAEVTAGTGTNATQLPGRVHVAGVLGYPKAFVRIARLLEDHLGLEPATTSVVDDALAAVGSRTSMLVVIPPRVRLAPDEPAGEAAVRVLRRQADIIEANLPGTIDDLDPEFLHDLRIAVRSSRSVLRQMKTVFDPGARRAQADALRWIQAVTGPTRDLDVQLLAWGEQVARLPTEQQAALDVAHWTLAARRASAFRAMKATLRGTQHRQRWTAWRQFLDQQLDDQHAGRPGPEAHRPVRRVARRRIRSIYHRMVREGLAIDDDSPAQALHDLRKRGKELRYLLEMFGSVFPKREVRPMATALKALQDVLGRHQDGEVQAANQLALAPELTTLSGGAETLLALGALIDRSRFGQQRARDQFAEVFAGFVELTVPG